MESKPRARRVLVTIEYLSLPHSLPTFDRLPAFIMPIVDRQLVRRRSLQVNRITLDSAAPRTLRFESMRKERENGEIASASAATQVTRCRLFDAYTVGS